MTNRYRDAAALRRAIEIRLAREASDGGADLARRRRLVVFDRVAARLSTDPAGGWVLKGGAALEFRLGGRARTTKDMDLAAAPDAESQLAGTTIRELLIEALAIDEDRDGFRFQVSTPVELQPDTAGRAGYRFSVESRLAGKPFATIRMDVVLRGEEISRTERLPLPNPLEFAGVPGRDIEAVDRRQHFAEKLHAFTRDYGARPNTRVKDLVDLVLLIESGLTPDDALAQTVGHVFAVRATHPVPGALPAPPPNWAESYQELARGLTDTAPELRAALGLVRGFWTALEETTNPAEGST
jgi:hypothetical protein